MRTQTNYAVLIVLSVFLCLYGCGKNEETVIEEQPENTGFIGIQAELKQEINVSAGKQPLGLEEVLDDMFVKIYAEPDGATSLVVASNYRDLPPLIELPSGDYFLIMTSNDIFGSRFDVGKYGYETNFFITTGTTTFLSGFLELLDVAVSIDFTDDVLANYPDIKAEVEIGNPFSPNLSWLPIDDTRTGYFNMTEIGNVDGYDTLFSRTGDLTISIAAQSNTGDELLVTRTYEDASPNEHYMITVSYSTSSLSVNVSLGDEIIIEDEIPFPG